MVYKRDPQYDHAGKQHGNGGKGKPNRKDHDDEVSGEAKPEFFDHGASIAHGDQRGSSCSSGKV